MNWFSVAVWVGVTFLVYSNLATADSKLPGRRQIQILTQVKDCGIYRAVLTKATEEKAEVEARLKGMLQAGEESRRALETCAKGKGIPQVQSDRDEEQAAMACFNEYESWATQAYAIEEARLTAQSRRNDYERIQAFTRFQCDSMRMAKNP